MDKLKSKSIRVNPDLWRRAKSIAVQENLTMQEVIHMMLEEFCMEYGD